MSRIIATLTTVVLLLSVTSARADVITDWNTNALDVLKAANVLGNPWSRAMAMVHVAMADAVITVQNALHALRRRQRPPRPTRRPKPRQWRRRDGADRAAAGPEGAHRRGLRSDPDAIPRAREERRGDDRRAGGRRGARGSRERQLALPDTYRPLTTPGVWIPTTPPIAAQYARARPWPSTGPTSCVRARRRRSIRAVRARLQRDQGPWRGAQHAAHAEQTDAVKFWTQSNFTESWFQAAGRRQWRKQAGLADSARLFAIVAMAAANSFIVDWDAKFHYNFWRPVTAIRNGDNDGNDATERDAGWTPFNATPMHPEYPSQASILAGVGAAVRIALAPDAADPLTIVDSADPKTTRLRQTPPACRGAAPGADLGRRALSHVAGSKRPDGPQGLRAPAEQRLVRRRADGGMSMKVPRAFCRSRASGAGLRRWQRSAIHAPRGGRAARGAAGGHVAQEAAALCPLADPGDQAALDSSPRHAVQKLVL